MAEQFPKWGDPQLLPKPTLVRDSYERSRFDGAGKLKLNGPGPLPEGFLNAPDILGLPWTRKRGDEWTTPEFRALVLRWLSRYLKARKLTKWDIMEAARGRRMSAHRLPPSEQYLKIAVIGRVRAEVAIPFPEDSREGPMAAARLALAAQSLDALL